MAFDWIVMPAKSRGLPCDFRIFLIRGDTKAGRRLFAAYDSEKKNAGLADKPRALFVRKLLAALRAEAYSAESVVRMLTFINRFFIWADDARLSISLATAAERSRQFSDAVSTRGAHYRAGSAWMTKRIATMLNCNERALRIRLYGNASSEWVIDLPKADPPYFDFRSLMTPGTTAMRPLMFSRLSNAKIMSLVKVNGRTRWLKDILNALNNAQKRTSNGHTVIHKADLVAVRRLFLKMDDLQIKITRASAFQCLRNRTIDPTTDFADILGNHLLRVLSWVNLTEDERGIVENARARRSVFTARPVDSEWVLHFPEMSTQYIDVRMLIRPAAAKRGLAAFSKLSESERQSSIGKDARTRLMQEVLQQWRASFAQGAAPASVSNLYVAFRHFIVWSDTYKYAVTKDAALDSLASYSAALMNRVKAGSLLGSSARYRCLRIASFLAPILNTTSASVMSHLANIAKEPTSGRQGDYVGATDTKTFVAWLESFVDAIRMDVLNKDLSSGLVIQNGNHAIKISGPELRYIGRAPNLFLNVVMARMRISAELLRFIAVTGANKSVALSTRIAEVDWTHDQGGYRLKVFKTRKGGHVSVTIPKIYRPILERHIAFVETLTEAGGNPDGFLFPSLKSDSPADLVSRHVRGDVLRFTQLNIGADIFRDIRHIFRVSSLRFLPCSYLRYAKGDFLHTAHNGDSLRTSQSLGNSPSVARASYGGNGNLPAAQREMTLFWTWQETFVASIAPGACAEPGSPKSLGLGTVAPACGAENACFSCDHYRGVDSIDYIYLVLSRGQEMRTRAGREPARAREFMAVVDDITAIERDYLKRHPDQLEEIEELRERVGAYDLHPTLIRHAEIYRRFLGKL